MTSKTKYGGREQKVQTFQNMFELKGLLLKQVDILMITCQHIELHGRSNEKPTINTQNNRGKRTQVYH